MFSYLYHETGKDGPVDVMRRYALDAQREAANCVKEAAKFRKISDDLLVRAQHHRKMRADYEGEVRRLQKILAAKAARRKAAAKKKPKGKRK